MISFMTITSIKVLVLGKDLENKKKPQRLLRKHLVCSDAFKSVSL